jgi:hypothetical protein
MIEWLVTYGVYVGVGTMLACVGGLGTLAFRAMSDAANWRHEAFRLQRNVAVGDQNKTRVWAHAKPEINQWHP